MTFHYLDVELYSRPCKCDEYPIKNIRNLSHVKMPESEVSSQTIMILFTKKKWLTWLTVSRLLNSSMNMSKKLLTAWSCCFSFLSRTLCMCCMACMRASDSDKLCWIAEAWVATISLYFFSEASVFQHIYGKVKRLLY